MDRIDQIPKTIAWERSKKWSNGGAAGTFLRVWSSGCIAATWNQPKASSAVSSKSPKTCHAVNFQTMIAQSQFSVRQTSSNPKRGRYPNSVA